MLVGNGAIAPNAPNVVSETMDGEAIIMHHGTGAYFDATGSGALIWEMIERTTTPAAIAARLVTVYGLDAGHADAVTLRFLATLEDHGLIKPVDGDPVPLPVAGPPLPDFAEPVLRVHHDLADMLLLDPIHDVDAAGWPSARVATPATGSA